MGRAAKSYAAQRAALQKRPEEDRLKRRARCTSPSKFSFGFSGRAGDLLVAGGPQRMLLAAVRIGIGFGRNVFARGAFTFFERIRIFGQWLWS